MRTESQLRTLAWNQGMKLRKDRARSWNVNHLGGYRLVDADSNSIVAGERYDLTLAEVAEFLDGGR
jgi:hypothetical protein